ncbi:MAG: hypothetical protein AAGA93_26975 [Actinomycetota bacterium]
MHSDIANNIGIVPSIDPQAHTASANGAGVDLADFGSAAVVVVAGAITDGTHTITVEESDDNSAFTAVAAEDLDGTYTVIDSDDDGTVQKVGYQGTKRFIRAVTTVAGVTTGGIYGVHVVKGSPRVAPVA